MRKSQVNGVFVLITLTLMAACCWPCVAVIVASPSATAQRAVGVHLDDGGVGGRELRLCGQVGGRPASGGGDDEQPLRGVRTGQDDGGRQHF